MEVTKTVKKGLKTASPTVHTVALDWLEIVFTRPGKMEGDEFKPRKSIDISNPSDHELKNAMFTFIPLHISTRVYRDVHEVFLDGEKIGIMYSQPHKGSYCNPAELRFWVENSSLYGQWHENVHRLISLLSLDFDRFGRVDIACDGFGFIQPMQDMMKGLCRKRGASRWSPVFQGNGTSILDWRIGSFQSDKYIRGYFKYREIDQTSKKYYIFDYWRANGLEPSPEVQRLELRMKGKELARFFKGDKVNARKLSINDLWQLRCHDFLAGVVRAQIKGVYDFVVPDSSNISRCTAYLPLAWNIGCKYLFKTSKVIKHHVRSVQTTIKQLYQLHVASGRQYYRDLCDEITHNTGLNWWVEKRAGRWRYEAELNERKGRKYLGILQTYEPGQQLTLYPVPSL